MKISIAQDSEISIVAQIIRDAFREYDGKLDPPSGALSETEDGIRAKLDGRGYAVLVRNEEVPVGTALFYKESETVMYIGRVSVLPSCRGQGVGRKMMHYIEDLAVREGCLKVRVGARLSLPDNIEMYSKMGYDIVEKRDYPEQTDSWYVMVKELSEFNRREDG
ncbi:GNAT family N-acetyltransferase [Paenibacillus sp. JX-17]|uniref:GNAT family N-acetyltransferase n=1 Tax=Paenibacillus lacisoli TaxID=3064525 RepID=A0ABT9CEG4_9BACL|nr:GNAT family N-acetyltransferase [Paenibacillus sp. JX-17]MDO7907664.1 GNAT family N-acetyltransferase [Paenibacillus sp. JX-17]